MFYAIVSFGGAFPGPSVYTSLEEALDAITQAERDTAGGGDMYWDTAVLARARINEYETREAAERANIADTTGNSRGGGTPGFVRTVSVRS